jgi:hypothetical protein
MFMGNPEVNQNKVAEHVTTQLGFRYYRKNYYLNRGII